MKVFESMIQGSEEWFDARKGVATASEFGKILTPTGRLSKSSTAYMRKLTRECIIDDPMTFLGNDYTEWGNEYEKHARKEFEEVKGEKVHEVGFCISDRNNVVGCSPDGLIKDMFEKWTEGLEIKCPSVDKHVQYLMEGELPGAYKMQVHGSMAVTGLNAWWFMSYFPGLRPLIIRVERDEFTNKLDAVLDEFVIEYAKVREEVLKAILPE
jgi:putative phage-type endonuclease